MGDSKGSAPGRAEQAEPVLSDEVEELASEQAVSPVACPPSFQEFRAAILAALQKGDPTKAPSQKVR